MDKPLIRTGWLLRISGADPWPDCLAA